MISTIHLRCYTCRRLAFAGADADTCKDCGSELQETKILSAKDLGRINDDGIGRCHQCHAFGTLMTCCTSCEDQECYFEPLDAEDKLEAVRMIQQPKCIHYNTNTKCNCADLCPEVSNRFSKEMNQASTILDTIRAYEVMVENGLPIRFSRSEQWQKKHYTYIRAAGAHAKYCLCPLCKLCIVTRLDAWVSYEDSNLNNNDTDDQSTDNEEEEETENDNYIRFIH